MEGSSTFVNLDSYEIGLVQISENMRKYFDEEDFSPKFVNADMNCVGARDQTIFVRSLRDCSLASDQVLH